MPEGGNSEGDNSEGGKLDRDEPERVKLTDAV